MRLLVECTYVYDNPHINSGIQRVVRNITTRLKNDNFTVNATPVVLKNGHVYEVKQLSSGSFNMSMSNWLHSKLIRARMRFWFIYHRLIPHWPFSQSTYLRAALYYLFKMGGAVFFVLIQWISYIGQRREIGKRIFQLSVSSNDVIILLDSSWHADWTAQIEKLKQQGVKIVAVIYDLIPFTHPQFCDDALVLVYQRWFNWVSQFADGFITISETVCKQLQAHIEAGKGHHLEKRQWFDYFYLGSDLDLIQKNDVIRPHVRAPFENGYPVYLMVGTIEPRKNHVFLLDAFDLLWQKGMRVSLCFVGGVGWKCQALIKRVKAHPEHKRRLFMFNDLNDKELEYCYKHSRSLVFPAYVEGFGLPLVEAMQRGLPVMASNIPVLREIGGDYIAYFNPEKPQTLVSLVQNFENNGKFPAMKTLEDWAWLSWEDSTRQFIAKILLHLTSSGGDDFNRFPNAS